MRIVRSEDWYGDEWARINFADYEGPGKAFVQSHQSYCREMARRNRELALIVDICFTQGFIGRLIADKAASVTDPRSGYRRRTTSCSRLTFGVNQYVVYHFIDGPRLDVVVGYLYDFPVCLVYHDTETVLRVGSAYICGEFDFSAVARACLTLTPTVADLPRPKPVVWDTADIENLGHSYWQNMTALDFFKRAGFLDLIDGVTPQKHDFFGLKQYGRASQQFKTFEGEDALFFRYSDYFIRKSVRETTLEIVSDTLWLKHQQSASKPTVLFQIRAGARQWAGQIDGIASIITEIAARRPDMEYIIDGRSRYVGDAPEAGGDCEQEQEVFRQISSRLPDHISVTSTIGWEMPEKMARFAQLRAFCGPIGSGFVILHWVLNRRGVVYGPPAMYGWTKDHGDHANESLGQLFWYPPDQVKVVEGGAEGRDSIVSFDWRVIFEALMVEIQNAEVELHNFSGGDSQLRSNLSPAGHVRPR